MVDCSHENFAANVRVNRLRDSGKFTAEVTVTCSDCGLPFQFLGLAPGLDLGGARVSLDGIEAVLAIAPKGAVPSPFQALQQGRSNFDG